ncbi:MAG: Gmad2 immunoglobulin-like domain-containing protein [Minisyncoccia bacterium]|jgi:hypothetical protein
MNALKLLKIIVIAFAIIIVVLLGVLIFVKPVQGPGPDEFPVAVSHDGRLVVMQPRPGTFIASPVALHGSVTGGGWFFEAVFPVKVLDGDGTVLGQGQAQAESDWMTTGTVPFSASISFSAPRYATGTVVFTQDTPRALTQNGEKLSVPVRFR